MQRRPRLNERSQYQSTREQNYPNPRADVNILVHILFTRYQLASFARGVSSIAGSSSVAESRSNFFSAPLAEWTSLVHSAPKKRKEADTNVRLTSYLSHGLVPPAAATAAVSPTAAATATAAAATAALFTRAGFVHGQAAPIDFLQVESLNRRLGLSPVGHLHEAKALAPARVAVLNDLRTLYLAILGEQRLQAFTGDAVAQVTDIQSHSHGRIPDAVARPDVAFRADWKGTKVVVRQAGKARRAATDSENARCTCVVQPTGVDYSSRLRWCQSSRG